MKGTRAEQGNTGCEEVQHIYLKHSTVILTHGSEWSLIHLDRMKVTVMRLYKYCLSYGAAGLESNDDYCQFL